MSYDRYCGYVTPFLEKLKKELWARYIFSSKKNNDVLQQFYAVCDELEKRKNGDQKQPTDKNSIK